MAYFKLILMKPIHTNQPDNSKYLLNTISEFYSQNQEEVNNKENLYLNSKFSFCYTYNEKFSIHKHCQKELTFSMNEQILYNDMWITNPFAPQMMIGTKLCLEDKYGDQHLFTVKDISYDIKENNKIFNITCQDSFSYQMSRQNEGYEITNDSSSDNFIGAKTIDWWIYFKIHKDCYIPYTYLPLNVGLYEYELIKIKEKMVKIIDKVTHKPNFIVQEEVSREKIDGKIDYFKDENEKNSVPKPELFESNGVNYRFRYEKKIKRIIKPIYDQEQYSDYYETFPFTVSGSNANAALISVSETLGLMLNVYEHQTQDQQQFVKYYWVGPERIEKNNGLYYSPSLDVQSFSFSQAGESLTTVMNVNGPTFEDEIVTLIPDVPPFFLSYFSSKDWLISEFYPGFYTEVCQGQSYHLIHSNDEDQGFKIIYNENGEGAIDFVIDDNGDLLIPIQLPYLKDNNGNFQSTSLKSWFNKVSFAGSELELTIGNETNTQLFYPEFNDFSIKFIIPLTNTFQESIINVDNLGEEIITYEVTALFHSDFYFALNQEYLLKHQDTIYKYKCIESISQKNEELSNEFWTYYDSCCRLKLIDSIVAITNNAVNNQSQTMTNDIYQAIQKNQQAYLRINTTIDSTITSVKVNSAEIYMRWFRDVSDEELQFAAIADQCPWLENKLIDFSYFANHDLITKHDELLLKNTINNDLRKINGQLMQYTKQYYEALHSKTKIIANITNSFDILGAEMESALYSPYAKEGGVKDSNFESVYNTYNAIWVAAPTEANTILNYDELMTEYFNKYFTAQQRFLKNIYNFRKYWNSPVGFGGTGIYENKITINYTSDDKIVLFQEPKWREVDSKFQLYQDDVPLVKLYENSTSTVELNIVTSNNFKEWYIPTIKTGQWTKCQDTGLFQSNVFYAKLIDKNGDDIEEPTHDDEVDSDNKYEQILYTEIIKRHLKKDLDEDGNSLNFYYREEPYYKLVEDGKFINFKPSDNSPKTQWYSDIPDRLDLPEFRTIYNEKGLSAALNVTNYTEELSKDELDDWTAMVEDNNNQDERWSHLIKSYIEGLPIDQLYWKGKRQTCSNLATFDNNISYYTTWKNKQIKNPNVNDNDEQSSDTDAPEEYLPVAYVTPKNYTSYFKRVAFSESAYDWSWAIVGVGRLIYYLIGRWGTGHLAQSGVSFDVLDNGKVMSNNESFAAGIRDYINWTRLMYGTDVNADKLIDKYLSMSGDNTPNDYYKFWKWIAPTYSVLTNNDNNNWKFEQDETFSFYPQGLYYKTKILRILKNTDVINNQDSYMSFMFNFTDENRLFNSSNIDSFREIFKECWTDEESYQIDVIKHYPLYNMCAGVKFSFTEETSSMSLESWINQDNSGLNFAYDSDSHYIEYIWKDRENNYIIFFELQDYEEKEISIPEEDASNYLTNLINNYYIYDKTTHLPVNWYNLPGLVKGLYAQTKKDGNYQQLKKLEEYKNLSWEEWLTSHANKQLYQCVDKDTEVYKPVYKLADYMIDNSPLHAYYLNAEAYTETSFTSEISTLKPTLYLYDKTSGQINKYNQIIDLEFKHQQSYRLQINSDYTLSYSCEQTEIANFDGITNGTFWYKYHEYNETQPLLFEHAASIETQLTQYWTSAYVASHYIEYFLPEFWQKVGNQATNHFNKHLIYYNNTEAVLLNDFIPNVEICNDINTNKSVLPRYKLTYIENAAEYIKQHSESQDGLYSNIQDTNFFAADEVLINNDAVINAFQEIGWNADELKNWQAEKVGEGEYGQTYYYVRNNSGKRRNKFPQELSKGFKELSNYTGTYIMLLKYLDQYYANRPMTTYYDLQHAHEETWRKIYREYPGLLLEGNFTSDSATNSKDLLFLAKNAFKDLSNPERNYSLTFIDINSLRGYEEQKLEIGMSIQLDVNEYVEEYGDLSQALSQFLFISDISYDLRKDSDINLTVNIIKYQDKLIQRLAKLIK